jgi:hypothetical protein
LGKLNDLDYCYASIVLLEELEKVSYARNQRLRQFHEKVHARQAIVAAALALILPVIVWVYLLTAKVSIFDVKTFAFLGPRVVGVLMITALLFLIPYLFLHMVWCQPFLRSFRRIFETVLRAHLISDVKVIDDKATNIVTKDVFLEERVPESYLTVEFLTLLVRYFECGQATFMKEALYELKMELENTGYYSSANTRETLLQREKAYLADEKRNLELMIEKEEGINEQ